MRKRSVCYVVFKLSMYRGRVSFGPCSGRGRPVLLVDLDTLLDPFGGLPCGVISLLVPRIEGGGGVDASGKEVVVLSDVASIPED